MATNRFTFKKIIEEDPAFCWYCNSKTLFSLTDNQNGSEIWCCSECAIKHAKIKRLKTLLRKYPLKRKSLKIESVLPIKKLENNELEHTSYRQMVLEERK